MKRLTLAFSLVSLVGAPVGTSAQPSARPAVIAEHRAPAWSRAAVIYEVNVRQYTPEGTLAAFQPHLPRLKRLGVDILWLMPVQPIGVKNRKGSLGSPYSIANYTAVDPAYGTAADFKAVVDAAHRQGMKVILDWVANHTAFDHSWTTQHRDFYVLRADGAISNARDEQGHETDWTDVAQLDYRNHELWQAMIGAMRWWVVNMGIDGFRCDVAGGPPLDFWRAARDSLTAIRSDLFMLAESENPALHAVFDATYGWELHHLLNDIAQGKKSTGDLDTYFTNQDGRFPRGAYRMYFTSNHDENSWNGSEFERMGENHLAAFVLSATVRNSMPLLYTGQEASMNKRLRFFDKDTVDWTGPSLASFYRSVAELKHANRALWNGAFGGGQSKLDTDGGPRVYAFTRTRDKNTLVVVVNFGEAPARFAYSALGHPGRYVDWFSKASVSLGRNGQVEVPAHGWRVFVQGSVGVAQ